MPLSTAKTRVAAIDCGTNSLRLLVADFDAATGSLVEVERLVRVVRLGEGVDELGRISQAAIDRAVVVLEEYRQVIHRLAVAPSRVVFVATSAARDARNAQDFVAAASAAVGVVPQVISGELEAQFSFSGAVAGLVGGSAPFLVVDVGGGSTELVLGDAFVESSVSVDLGCVRLTEQGCVQAEVDRLLGEAFAVVPVERAGSLVGLAGSVTTITAHALGLREYDSSLVHGADVPVGRVVEACAELVAMGRDELALLPYMHPGRVDVMRAGAMIWSSVVQHVARVSGVESVRTSEHDILDGAAMAVAGRAV